MQTYYLILYLIFFLMFLVFPFLVLNKEERQAVCSLLIKTIIIITGICFLIWFANKEVLKWFNPNN